MVNKIYKVAVGGPIGIGKTTFCNTAAARYKARIIREMPQDEDHIFYKFLDAMYNNKVSNNINLSAYYAFAFQSIMLGERSNKQWIEDGKRYLYDRTVLEDRFFAEKLITDSWLREIYIKMWDTKMRELSASGLLPDHYIIIRADRPGRCEENILARARGMEISNFNKNKDYYNEVEAEYTQYMIRMCDEYGIPYDIYSYGNPYHIIGEVKKWGEEDEEERK